ncbi:MAG: hypothetical protein H6983_05420 [Ectothiorhodospiraceae bacterium]|nr:hypothetical protein [Chromatiales bacterium]MCP5153581.1 hypothetical protein [Ectothiorhodospiraceae bacterium]
MRSLLAIVLLAVTTAAPAARMYQWVNPLTGTPVLSGTPPAWYRSVQGGPRVRVFENGMLVDDTVIALSPKHSEELREAAFDEAERQAEAEAVKRLERAARREAMRQDESTVAAAPGGGEPQTAGAGGQPSLLPEQLDQGMIDRLKSIIQTWDQQGTEQASR